jgi:hypothetical protein
MGGERIDGNQIQLVKLDRVVPIDAGVRCPERNLACVWIDQPAVFVVGLVRQRGCDLVYVELG